MTIHANAKLPESMREGRVDEAWSDQVQKLGTRVTLSTASMLALIYCSNNVANNSWTAFLYIAGFVLFAISSLAMLLAASSAAKGVWSGWKKPKHRSMTVTDWVAFLVVAALTLGALFGSLNIV